MMKHIFPTLDQAYKELFNDLNYYAKKHLLRKDESIDAVHEAFEKTLANSLHTGIAEIKRNKLFKETFKACKRLNKSHTQEEWYVKTEAYTRLAKYQALGNANKHPTSDKSFDISGELGYDDYSNTRDA